jgi:glycosyltransferase 2 family protein
MKEEKNRTGKNINRLFILVGVGIVLHVIFLLSTIDKKSFSVLLNIRPLYLLAIALLALGPWIGHTCRVMIWSKFLKHPIKLRDAIHVVVANEVGSAVAPTAIGGGPVKIGMLMKYGVPASRATFMVLLSACEDLIFYLSGTLVTFIYMREQIYKMGGFLTQNKWLFFGTLSILFVSIFFKKMTGNLLRKFLKILPLKMANKIRYSRKKILSYFSDIGATFGEVIRDGKVSLLMSVALLFFQWFTKFSILVVILYALGIQFEFSDIYIKQWILIITLLFIPTPGASGGAEAGFLLLFGQSLPGDLANLMVSTWRFFTYYYILMMSALIFNLMLRFNKDDNVIIR